MLVVERCRANRGVPRSAYVAALLAVGCLGLALYAKGLRSDLTAALRPKPQPAASQPGTPSVPTAPLGTYAQGELYQPQHPPRLGGRYYRGNDERGASLFNGGFYQTAVMDVELLDEAGVKLQPGDVPQGPLQVRVAIRRSPHATPVLFTDEKLMQSCLSPMPPRAAAELGQGPKHYFTVVEPGECWEAIAPLPALSPDEPRSGELFLYYGSPSGNGGYNGSPHYQVSYRLVLNKDGRLTADSTLHMASSYQVSQVVKLPESRMTPEQWFDFRPMPEIVEPQTSDPQLLGIEEHSPVKGATAETPSDSTP
jgi:hypothetical protein